MRRSHLAAGLTAAVVMSTAAVPVSAAPVPVRPSTSDGLTTQVTLVTGDVVRVTNGEFDVQRAPGRERVAFSGHRDVRGDLHVVPLDVQQQINTGKLDKRLFDISLLTRFGYDDASRSTIPLIVEGGATPARGRKLGSINAQAVAVEKNGGFWAAKGDAKVWLDGKVTATLDRSAAQINAPQAWEQGFTGAGATVAVLDGGVDAEHPDLADAVVEARNFTDSPTADDVRGHGTHVASTITGSGQYRGIAPDAKIINAKVLGDTGSGYDSWIIAGMEWAATRTKVVNMSLGGRTPSDGTDPFSQALNRISAQTGALFVVAAGNDPAILSSPAAADSALTVGAVERDERLADFSARGPRPKDHAIKPDITAPGVGIVAAKVGGGHVAKNGTSMAAPHVAGAAAILAAQHPTWTGQDLKAALMNAAKPNPALSVFEQGAGRVDVVKATSAQVTASPGSLGMGIATWPHGDDVPVAKKLTYRNNGTAPVTIDLSIVEQKPAPGVFSVSPAQLTIPAGGTAEATVTADTRVNGPDALHTAAVLSSDGTRTPLAVDKEAEKYNVTLKFLDHNGNPTKDYAHHLVDTATRTDHARFDESGTVTYRLPKGEYYLDAKITTGSRTTVTTEPALVLGADLALTLDARDGIEPKVVVDRPDAVPADTTLGTRMDLNGSAIVNTWYGRPWSPLLVRPSATSSPKFRTTMDQILARPDDTGSFFQDSPYQYHVRVTDQGRMPVSLRWQVRDSELAPVDTVVHARVPGSIGVLNGVASGALPWRLETFYTPGVPWRRTLSEMQRRFDRDNLGTQSDWPRRTFTLGERITETWNTGVFGPALPEDPTLPVSGFWASRRGDSMDFSVPLFSDGSGVREGRGQVSSGSSFLMRNGKVVDAVDHANYFSAAVPAGKGDFRFKVEALRPSASSKVVADWKFTSDTTTGWDALPLLAVRFSPKLDDHNRAEAGKQIAVPVTVQRNGAVGTVTDVTRPEIQVSYDEGATWQPVHAFRPHGARGWSTAIIPPVGAKSVSYKAKTSDANGSVEQTIIRAFDLK